MNQRQIAAALNEWMRQYIADPKAFCAEFESVEQFKRESRKGKEPSYGEVGASLLHKLHKELGKAERERLG